MDHDATWYGGRPRPRRLCVPWGPSSPHKKGTAPTQCLAHVYCGQTVGWIKMPLTTEVNLGPADVLLDGVAAPPKRGTDSRAQPPVFGSCLLWPNGWMDEDANLYGSRPWCMPHCVRQGPSSPVKEAQQLPVFSVHVYSGHGRPSQLLLSCCWICERTDGHTDMVIAILHNRTPTVSEVTRVQQ